MKEYPLCQNFQIEWVHRQHFDLDLEILLATRFRGQCVALRRNFDFPLIVKYGHVKVVEFVSLIIISLRIFLFRF